MRKFYLFFWSFQILTSFLIAQVGINTNTPNPNSILHASESENGSVDGAVSIFKGVIVPRYTDAERDGNFPSLNNEDNGLLIYNTDTDCYNYWSQQARSWMQICGTVPGVQAGYADILCISSVTSGMVIEWEDATGAVVEIPYENGNGGNYDAQSFYSSNIPGLQADLEAGTYATGSGYLYLNLSGIPMQSGTAFFDINIGGSACELMIQVEPAEGSAIIDCDDSTVEGTVTEGEAAVGVTVNVPYTNGNGGTYPPQSYNSNGITGLTASLAEGNFENGSGELVFQISGTPSSSGTATFNLDFGGTTCAFTVTVDEDEPIPAVVSSCSVVVQGNYAVMTPLTGANKIVVTVNVTQAGPIKLVSQDKNGMKFESAEVVLATGSQQVTMNSVTATSGVYPLTSEETSNGANGGGDNQKGTYTITNTLTGTNLSCTASIDVKPRVLSATNLNADWNSTNTGNINGPNDGLIQMYMFSKYSNAYYNVMIRNTSGSNLTYEFNSTSYYDTNRYTYSGSISAGGVLGSLDPAFNTSNPAPSTAAATAGPFATYPQGAEVTGVGLNIQYNGKWYKYRLIYDHHELASSRMNMRIVLFGIYNTKPAQYQPAAYQNQDYNQQSYWP